MLIFPSKEDCDERKTTFGYRTKTSMFSLKKIFFTRSLLLLTYTVCKLFVELEILLLAGLTPSNCTHY